MSAEQPEKTPTPAPSRLDSRLSAFLRKAAPVIAVEKGINARSRVKLESLARDVKLPDELFDQALALLQEAPPRSDASLNRWERDFAKRLRSQMKKLRSGILTAAMEQQAVDVGKEQYQLDEFQAREIIQLVATEVGIGRISISEAERHLEALVREKIGSASWVVPDNRDRLHEAGRRWGLPPEHVDTLIAYYTQVNRDQVQRGKRLNSLLVGGVTVVLFLALAAGLLAYLSKNNLLRLGDREATESETSGENGAAVENESQPMPEWWTESVRLASVKARLHVDGVRDIYPQLISDSPTIRADAYRDLADIVPPGYPDEETRVRLGLLIALLLQREPSPVAAEALADALVAVATPSATELPEDQLFYEQAFWLVETIAQIAASEPTPLARRQLLDRGLTAVTGATVEGAIDDDEAVARHLQGHCRACYRALIAAAVGEPGPARTRLQWLRPLAADILGEEQRIELDSSFVLAALPYEPDQWTELRPVIERCMLADNPLLHRFVSLAETTERRELQVYLLEEIASALRVSVNADNPERAAADLRQRIGVVPGPPEDMEAVRWARLNRRLNDLVPAEEIVAGGSPPSPDQILELAFFTTMACALSQSPTRIPDFDERLRNGPPSLNQDPPPRNPDGVRTGDDTRRPPSRTDRDRLLRHAQRLERWHQQARLQRVQAMKGLESLADRFDDLPPDFASYVADYLVGSKQEEEHLEVLTTLRAMSRWNHLLLAFADALDRRAVPEDWVEQMFIELTGQQLILDGRLDWSASLQKRLLSVVMHRLAPAPTDVNRLDARFDRLQAAYLNELETRRTLIGASGQAGAPALTTGDSMRQLVEQLSRSASDAADEDVPQQRQATLNTLAYLADSDLERTVLLQRELVAALAIRVMRNAPQHADEAREVLAELHELDGRSRHAATQLYVGEWCLMRLWRLTAS